MSKTHRKKGIEKKYHRRVTLLEGAKNAIKSPFSIGKTSSKGCHISLPELVSASPTICLVSSTKGSPNVVLPS